MSLLHSKPGQAISLATASLTIFSFQGCRPLPELPTIEMGKTTMKQLDTLAQADFTDVIVKGRAHFVGIEDSPVPAGFPPVPYLTNAYLISGAAQPGHISEIKVYTQNDQIILPESLVCVTGLLLGEGRKAPCVALAYPYSEEKDD